MRNAPTIAIAEIFSVFSKPTRSSRQFSDTNAQSLVYYGRYLPYFDHARTEYHRHLGLRETSGTEPVMRVNTDPAWCYAPGWDEAAAWDGYAEAGFGGGV